MFVGFMFCNMCNFNKVFGFLLIKFVPSRLVVALGVKKRATRRHHRQQMANKFETAQELQSTGVIQSARASCVAVAADQPID